MIRSQRRRLGEWVKKQTTSTRNAGKKVVWLTRKNSVRLSVILTLLGFQILLLQDSFPSRLYPLESFASSCFFQLHSSPVFSSSQPSCDINFHSWELTCIVLISLSLLHDAWRWTALPASLSNSHVSCLLLLYLFPFLLLTFSAHTLSSHSLLLFPSTASEVRFPRFRGNSYLALPTLRDSEKSMQLNIELRPEHYEGLILYSGEKQTLEGDFIALLLNQGFVEFR